MAFGVSRNSATIFQLPRSPRSEGNTGSSAQSLMHHRPLHFALYSTKAFQKTYWYDKGREAKNTDEISVFEVPELARTGEGISWLSSSQPCWKYLKTKWEPREISLPVSKLIVSMTRMKDTGQTSQQRDSLYYWECCSAPFRVLLPKSDALQKHKNRTPRTHTAATYSWPQKVMWMKPEM